MKTKIEYDGDTLVFTEGSVIKLHCKDEKMVDDLIITVYDDTSSGGDTGGDTGGDVGGGEEEKVYTLSGKWAFNPAPKKPSFSNYEISFTSTYSGGSHEYDAMIFRDGALVYNGKTGDVALCNWLGNWNENCSRVVDFGSTPVPVSKEFYEWFTANATEARILNSGDWVFKEKPTLKEIAGCTYISFNDFFSIDVRDSWFIEYRKSGTITVAYDASGWRDPGFRYISLTTPQAVPADFYEWFIANAYRELSGTWTFNRTITLPDAFIGMNLNGIAKFGEVAAYKVEILPEQLRINAHRVNSDWYVLYTAGLWTREKYRTVIFEEPIGVPDDFYEWFTSNALP